LFRRDFLKFLSAAGAVLIAPPLTVASKLPTPTASVIPEEPIHPDVVHIVFHFGEHKVVIFAEHGCVTYMEHKPLVYPEHGMLYYYEEEKWVDFAIDFRATFISDTSFINKAKASDTFDILVDGYTLRGCIWETIEYDFSQGFFHISGRTVQ
jgi:hypothetical protein